MTSPHDRIHPAYGEDSPSTYGLVPDTYGRGPARIDLLFARFDRVPATCGHFPGTGTLVPRHAARLIVRRVLG